MLGAQDHSSNSSQLRIQALQFLGVALKSTSPAVWQKHVKAIADAVTAAAGERYSMVSAEGLRVCESLVYVMRPDTSKPMQSSQKVLQAVVPCDFLLATHSYQAPLCSTCPSTQNCVSSCVPDGHMLAWRQGNKARHAT